MKSECPPCHVQACTVHVSCLAQQVTMMTCQESKTPGSGKEATVAAPAQTHATDTAAAAPPFPVATCKLRYRLVPYCSDAAVALTAQVYASRRWMHNPGLHIIQVYMDRIRWALWCVGGSGLVMPLPLPLSVQTTLPARQCFQLLGSPGGCTRWTSPCSSADLKCSPQPLVATVASGNAKAAPAQVCLCDAFDRDTEAAIVPVTRWLMLHVATYSGLCSVLMPWLYSAHAISYRLMPSPLAGAGAFVQVSAYCTTGRGSGVAYMCIWYVPATTLYRTPVYQYCSVSSLRCDMPTPRTGRSPLPRRRPPRDCEEGEVDPLCREPLRRMRAQGAESPSLAQPARTPLPRLRPRATRSGEERCKGEKPAASARQPAAKKARPQPKLHPWTSMTPLDRVVIRPRRTGDRAGRQDAKDPATSDEEDSSSTEDIRVCATPVVPIDTPTSATGARLVGRAKIRFKPRPVPPSKEAKIRGNRPGTSGEGLTATGARAKQKARQRKIRGSLRECLRIGARTNAKSKAMPSKGKTRASRTETSTSARSGQAPNALIPPASKQAPTHARSDMEAVAVLEPTDWTVVTDQPLPTDVVETSTTTADATPCSRSQETKEALLRWQREQFVQRAELARMQATMQNESHPNAESCDTSVYMGLPASPHVLRCFRLPLIQALSLFTYVEAAFWSAHETAHVCWTIAVHSQLMLAFRSKGWCWLLSTRPLPYSVCNQLTLMHGVYHIVPYRLRLCTYMLSRRILIIMRLCVGILLVWWRALFGTCLCGLRCKRWTVQARRLRRSPHQRCDTKLQIPIRRSEIPPPPPRHTQVPTRSQVRGQQACIAHSLSWSCAGPLLTTLHCPVPAASCWWCEGCCRFHTGSWSPRA